VFAENNPTSLGLGSVLENAFRVARLRGKCTVDECPVLLVKTVVGTKELAPCRYR